MTREQARQLQHQEVEARARRSAQAEGHQRPHDWRAVKHAYVGIVRCARCRRYTSIVEIEQLRVPSGPRGSCPNWYEDKVRVPS